LLDSLLQESSSKINSLLLIKTGEGCIIGPDRNDNQDEDV